jgi:hypothetical protein
MLMSVVPLNKAEPQRTHLHEGLVALLADLVSARPWQNHLPVLVVGCR